MTNFKKIEETFSLTDSYQIDGRTYYSIIGDKNSFASLIGYEFPRDEIIFANALISTIEFMQDQGEDYPYHTNTKDGKLVFDKFACICLGMFSKTDKANIFKEK